MTTPQYPELTGQTGKRKLILTIITEILIFTGIMFGKIPGDVGVWSLVSCLGATVLGYGAEYLWSGNKVSAVTQILQNKPPVSEVKSETVTPTPFKNTVGV